MSDSYNHHQNNSRDFDTSREGVRRGAFRGTKPQNNRDGGGFRIRLSDNEMNSARSLQEAFNLRSTVAVLGFALRTLGQMLEEGKLDELVKEYKNQVANNNRRDQGTRSNRFNNPSQSVSAEIKANPFERPSKPSSSAPTSDTPAEESKGIEEVETKKNQADITKNDSIEETSRD